MNQISYIFSKVLASHLLSSKGYLRSANARLSLRDQPIHRHHFIHLLLGHIRHHALSIGEPGTKSCLRRRGLLLPSVFLDCEEMPIGDSKVRTFEGPPRGHHRVPEHRTPKGEHPYRRFSFFLVIVAGIPSTIGCFVSCHQWIYIRLSNHVYMGPSKIFCGRQT